MTQLLVTNCVGTFIIHNKKIEDKILFKGPEDFHNIHLVEQQENNLLKKHPKAEKTTNYIFPQSKELLPYFETYTREIAKTACQHAVKKEHLVIQAVETMTDIEKAVNPIVKRLRQWYSLYCPELSEQVDKHEAFVTILLTKEREEILKELEVKNTMGIDLSKVDLAPIQQLAREVKSLYEMKAAMEAYIETTLHDIAPNISAVSGSTLAAELLSYAGSVERLALMPSSTIQMLGAENALFQFMRGQGRSPKHGIIIKHALLASAKERYHGKIARRISGAISLAAKMDYFKGDVYKGYELREKLEKQVSEIESRKEKVRKVL